MTTHVQSGLHIIVLMYSSTCGTACTTKAVHGGGGGGGRGRQTGCHIQRQCCDQIQSLLILLHRIPHMSTQRSPEVKALLFTVTHFYTRAQTQNKFSTV